MMRPHTIAVRFGRHVTPLAWLLVAWLIGVLVSSCARPQADIVSVPFTAACPAGYRFWMTDQQHRVGLCVRDGGDHAAR